MKQNVIVDNTETTLRALVYLDQNEVFLVHLDLCEKVAPSCVVRVGQSGKIEIDLEKSSKQRWRSLGNPLEKHLWCGERKVSGTNYTRERVITFIVIRICPPPTDSGR